MQSSKSGRKRGRLWLYGPIVLVAFAVVWSIGWFVLRGKAETMMDAQLAREAAKGREWSCPDRVIGGFPFRFEVTCSNLGYRQGRKSVSLGPTKIVAQVYNPRHVILQAAGPLQAGDGVVSVSGSWKMMEASISGLRRDGFDRVSLITTQSSFTFNGLPQGPLEFTTQSTGLHVRPTPGAAAQERSFDIALDAQGVSQPELDAWTSDREPLQAEATFTLTGVPVLPAPTVVATLENWRQAGGVLRIIGVDLRKGARELTLAGEVRLDDEHKPDAVFKIGQANFSELLTRLTPGGDTRMKLLRPLKALPPTAAKEKVTQLPSVRIGDGEVHVGGLIKIRAQIPALY